jgi:hypothetical protein
VWNTFLTGKISEDQGRLLAVAYGAQKGDTIQIHVGVAPLILTKDPPTRDGKPMEIAEWIALHFFLRDEQGNSIPVQKLGTSSLMSGPTAGAPEFSVNATLAKNKKYALDFKPFMDEERRYRMEFTAPAEDQKVVMAKFDLVEEQGK